MSSNLYPRYGCSFCKSVDSTKELHKVHLDKFLKDVCAVKGTSLQPPGSHFLPLLCAVRRRSSRKGQNKMIALEKSAFDVCRNWRLFDVINDDQDLAAFFERVPHTRREWEALAKTFVDENQEEEGEAVVNDRTLWDSYVPQWSREEDPSSDEAEDGDEDEDDEEDDEDEDGEHEDNEHDDQDEDEDEDEDENEEDQSVYGRGGRSHGNGNQTKNIQRTSHIQSGFGSPVKAKNGKFHVHNGGNQKSHNNRALFDNGGEGSSKTKAKGKARGMVDNVPNKPKDKGKGKERGFESVGDGPSKKLKAGPNISKSKRKEKVKRSSKNIPEVIDLMTPEKQKGSQLAKGGNNGYDIWTPPGADVSMTLIVKGMGDRGYFEVKQSCTLGEMVAEIEERAGGAILALKLKGGRKIDDGMWNARHGASMTVAVEWEWSD